MNSWYTLEVTIKTRFSKDIPLDLWSWKRAGIIDYKQLTKTKWLFYFSEDYRVDVTTIITGWKKQGYLGYNRYIK